MYMANSSDQQITRYGNIITNNKAQVLPWKCNWTPKYTTLKNKISEQPSNKINAVNFCQCKEWEKNKPLKTLIYKYYKFCAYIKYPGHANVTWAKA